MTYQEKSKTKKELLIIDGHSSRENPGAMQLLSETDINVLILPSHTSHILQVLDVAISVSIKHCFIDIFNDGIKKKFSRQQCRLSTDDLQ